LYLYTKPRARCTQANFMKGPPIPLRAAFDKDLAKVVGG